MKRMRNCAPMTWSLTNTPIPQALEVIRSRLVADKTLRKRTMLKVKDIMELQEFVVSTTYFVFRGLIYKQHFGRAMGSPMLPIVVNLFMEDLESEAIDSALSDCKPQFWRWYVDDTLSIIKQGQASNLTDHLNTIDKPNSIKFTHEEDLEGKMPFQDTLIFR